jgi:D-beta-D-heptose 7-phosphate kinase/D-beta-D-heptose 1-phosphate adenosyltransferase
VILDFLEKNKTRNLNICCVGDAMIDEYYSVSVNRISPECPMSIMSSTSESRLLQPGGAANLAYQFSHFNVDVQLASFINDDFNEIFNTLNYQPSLIDDFHLPIKRRFLDQGVQVNRWDIEEPDYGGHYDLVACEEILLDKISSWNKPNVVIISDYNKGFFQSPQKWMDKLQKYITIVDPKKGPVEKWKGCTLFKPNSKEAIELSGGITAWEDQCRFFRDKLDCKSVVITQGSNGAVGYDGYEFFEHRPVKKIAVENAVGAGDCFAAFLGMAFGYGMKLRSCVEIAHHASVAYVKKRFNLPITPQELLQEVYPIEAKINQPIPGKKKIVFTNGCFDILHIGHLETLQFAKSKGDILIVGVNSDESVNRLKGEGRPINKLENRMKMLASLQFVDFVVSFDEDTPYELIKKISPDVLVKGGDYSITNIIGSDIVKEVYSANLIPDVSTTGMITAMSSTPLIRISDSKGNSCFN